MSRNKIIVFHPGSKKAAFDVLCYDLEAGYRAISDRLGTQAADKVKQAYTGLKIVGGISLTLKHDNRRIKVELAQAA